jgi:hypothetical protein
MGTHTLYLYNEDQVSSYENITKEATFGANLKAVDAYKIGPLFMSVGDKNIIVPDIYKARIIFLICNPL